MKYLWKEILAAIFLVLVMPWLLFSVMTPNVINQPVQTDSVIDGAEQTVPVYIDGQVKNMSLSEYLTGVLLCEMPGGFHMEAKKAQAVVARTYTLRTTAVKDKHPMQAVCTDPACCQGYRSETEYLSLGGSPAVVEQARLAVAETSGMVLTYQGELIDATYFACSGGQTEDALAVWGSDIPYLQSVESPGEENANHYKDSVQFTPSQFQQALGERFKEEPSQWIQGATYTRGGGVDTMIICGKTYSGTALRSALGLRSTAFTITTDGKILTVTTKGFGHRVGMSQYGADAMAQQGNSFQQILLHYYTDCQIGHADEISKGD